MKRFFTIQKWITFVSLLFVAVTGQAAELEEFYTGVRQLGMGGAYAAVVNDETAVLLNPAGLSKIRETTTTVLDPEVTGSSNVFGNLNSGNFTKVFDIQKLLDLLNQNRGVHWNAKVQVFPSIVGTNFGAGLHAKYSYNAEVDSAGTVYRLDYVNDVAAAMGYSLSMLNGTVKLGVTARAVDRTEIHKDLDPTSTSLSVSNQASEGLGVAADVGLIFTAPVQYLPTFAIVGHDLGNTSYTLSDGIFHSTQDRPQTTLQTVDVGVALFPILSNTTRMTLTADYRDVLQAYSAEKNAMKRVHVGAEINFGDLYFFRAGMNQRYWTGGMEFATTRMQFQIASYGEDIGTTSQPREDRRYVGKLVFRF